MSESDTSPLDVNSGAAALSALLGDEPIEKKAEAVEPESNEPEAAEPESTEEATEESTDEPERVTIEVDGKTVELTKEELAEAYKSGLRQADYTKKTMEAAETRKTADAELQRARVERETYAQRLQEQTVLLQAALNEQNQINWQQLIDSDPIEYLKQRNLFEQRQAALQNSQREQQQLMQIHQAEQAKQFESFVSQQRDNLLAKLPDWKDSAKAKAEQSAIREFLTESGFENAELDQLVDHRQVLIAREAMLYRQMMSKAKAAAKKVSTLPQKVEKPGVSETRTLDKRSSAFQRLTRSGSVEDAAAVFAGLI